MAIAFPSFGMNVSAREADFSPLAKLGQQFQQQQKQELQRQALNQYAQTGDPNVLLRTGDMSLAQLAIQDRQRTAQAERDARDFGFRQQESLRAQQNADRSYGLQSQAANKPTVQKVKDAAGNETLVQIYPNGRTVPLSGATGSGASEPDNPFAPSGKQTEGQANASLYARRMFQAEKVLRDPAVEDAAQSSAQRGLAMLPGAGRFYNPNSVEYQKFDQAQRDFINATLRRESGAVISDQEFDNARKQYFPAPGDSREVIAQKRRNRAEAIKGIAGAAGPAYRAPYTFDEAGELQERAPARQSGAASAPITQEQFNALPSGTVFTAPDGTRRIKP